MRSRVLREGLKTKGKDYDIYDHCGIEWEYRAFSILCSHAGGQGKHQGSADNKAPGNCSGFIATGSYTADGKIAIGHNNWTDYMGGERWNVIADIVPQKGNHFIMDCMPGLIHSGDDFVVSPQRDPDHGNHHYRV
jgi:hypothetical protein